MTQEGFKEEGFRGDSCGELMVTRVEGRSVCLSVSRSQKRASEPLGWSYRYL